MLLVLVSACGPSGPLKAQTIQLGKSLNPDNSVANHSTLFKPGETVYVAVLTAEPGASTITARWMYRGSVVNEASKQVSYRDAAATEFQLVSSGGFPAGDYSVEILIDGQSAGSRNFKVD